MGKYSPVENWTSDVISRGDPAYSRPAPGVTQYDNVFAGNITPGSLSINDPGQLGRGNLPGLHMPRPYRDEHVNPDMPVTGNLPDTIPVARRWLTQRGGTYDPFTFRTPTESHGDFIPAMANPGGLTGSGLPGNIPYMHGPITGDELDSAAGVRQPRNIATRSLWRRLLFLPEKRLDNTGAFDERVLPGVGVDSAASSQYPDSPAAVGTGNAFSVPDVRRTFDEPRDAPTGQPRDSTGKPIYDKAGYPLTASPLEPIDYEIQTSHRYSVGMQYSQVSPDRVRAGVQYDIASVRKATMPHWFYFRPFDQAIDHHNGGLKGQLRQPLASRPINTRETLPMDGAGRHFVAPAPGMEPIGTIPNVNRQTPQAWDSALYAVETGASMAHSAMQRANGWRLT